MRGFLISLFASLVINVQCCDEGLLFVGGEGPDGPLDTIHLLTKDGWCKNLDLPPLPEALPSPSVYFPDWSKLNYPEDYKEYVVLCGFSSGKLCRYARPGNEEWTEEGNIIPKRSSAAESGPSASYPPVPFQSSRVNLKFVKDDDTPLINMVVTNLNSSFQGTFLRANPETFAPFWTEREPSDVQLSSELNWNGSPGRKNLTGSCLLRVPEENSDVGHEYLITGGRYEENQMDMNSRKMGSDSAVGRMSYKGILDPPCTNGPGCYNPDWQSNVRPNLKTGREDHSCIGLKEDGKVSAMVVGGLDFYQIYGSSGYTSRSLYATYNTLSSTEIYDGTEWTFGPSLLTARTGAPVVDFCGELMVFGGKQQDGRYDWSENYVTPNDTWYQTVTDKVTTKYLDSVEKLSLDSTGKHWLLSNIVLPNKMSNFGVTKVYSSSLLCKDNNQFSCDQDGLFPSGPCENQFWHCSHGEPLAVNCDPGLVFSPEVGNCDWPTNVAECDSA